MSEGLAAPHCRKSMKQCKYPVTSSSHEHKTSNLQPPDLLSTSVTDNKYDGPVISEAWSVDEVPNQSNLTTSSEVYDPNGIEVPHFNSHKTREALVMKGQEKDCAEIMPDLAAENVLYDTDKLLYSCSDRVSDTDFEHQQSHTIHTHESYTRITMDILIPQIKVDMPSLTSSVSNSSDEHLVRISFTYDGLLVEKKSFVKCSFAVGQKKCTMERNHEVIHTPVGWPDRQASSVTNKSSDAEHDNSTDPMPLPKEVNPVESDIQIGLTYKPLPMLAGDQPKLARKGNDAGTKDKIYGKRENLDATAGSLKATVSNPFAANPIQVLTEAQLRNRRKYQVYKTSKTPKIYTCEHCPYTTPHSGSMTNHRFSHATEKSHICTYIGCYFKTASPKYLKRHLKTHSGEKPHLCDLCGKTFALKTRLTKHKLTHGIEKPFKCSQCSYATSDRDNLVSHNRIHSGEKPYKCRHCDYKAAHRTSIHDHVKRKHLSDSEAAEMKCDLCDYTSYFKQRLRQHMLTHTGEKPFKCTQCSYATSQKSSLVSHNRMHSGEKPYKCKHCDYEAARKSNMNRHMKCKHPCDSESGEQLDLLMCAETSDD